MSEISKQALKVDNNQSFPNNNAGAITPAILRAFNENMIDSMVDEISYNADSASWNSQIQAISASAGTAATGSLLTTASFSGNTMTFTKGDGSTFGVVIPDVSGSTNTALNEFTASVAGTNAFTQSAQISINALNSATSSYAISSSVAAVDKVQTDSINAINAWTSSVVPTNISALNAFTASVAGTNAFTQSTNLRLDSLENTSASVNVSVSSLNGFTASVAGTNAFTQSAQNSLNSLNAATSSYITSAMTASMSVASASVAATASIAREVVVNAINDNQSTLPVGTVVRITGATGDNPRFNSASWDNDATSANTLGILGSSTTAGTYGPIVTIGTVIGIDTDGMAAGDVLYLGPNGTFTNVQPQAPQHIVTLGEVLRVQSNNGSMFVNISNGWELNELHNVRIVNPLQGDLLVYEASSSLWKNQTSSSFAKTNQANTFNADQIVSGSMTVTGNLEVFGSASFITVTSSVILGGNTILLNTFSPSVRFGGMEVIDSGSTGLTGSLLWDSEKDKWIYTNPSGGAYNSGMLISGPKNTSAPGNELGLVTNYIVKAVGDDHISSSQMQDDGVTVTIPYTASIGNIVGLGNPTAFSTSVDSRIDALVASTTDITALNAFSASTNLFTASVAGTNAFTQSANSRLTELELASASALVNISAGINPLEFTYTTKDGGTSLPITLVAPAGTDITALNNFTASIAGTNAFTQSINSRVSGLEAATASYAISSSVAAVDLGQQNQINALIAWTGSVVGTDITALNNFTASIAGTNAFTASATLRLNSLESTSASVNTSLASLNGFTASVAGTNLFTQSAQLEINALEAFSASALTTASFSGNTLTFTKGNGTTFGVILPDVSGSTINTGSFATTGSNVFIGTEVFSGSVQGRVIAATITSNTASLDFSQGNFFTLALAATVGTHISASNVQPGETVSVRITQNATPGTLTYPPSMKFPSGSAYTASTIANAVDIVTFISYDNSTVFASSVKNMI